MCTVSDEVTQHAALPRVLSWSRCRQGSLGIDIQNAFVECLLYARHRG